MKRSRGGRRILRERLEDLRQCLAFQALPPHVPDDADHRVPRAVGIPQSQLEPSADGIVPRPRPPGHRIVDDRDPRSVGPIRARKETAAEQRRSEGSEEIRADLVSREAQAIGDRAVVAFDGEDVLPGVTPMNRSPVMPALSTPGTA